MSMGTVVGLRVKTETRVKHERATVALQVQGKACFVPREEKHWCVAPTDPLLVIQKSNHPGSKPWRLAQRCCFGTLEAM